MSDSTTPAGNKRPPRQSRTGLTSTGARKAGSKSDRSRAREFALQGLYQYLVGRNAAEDIDLFTRDLAGFNRADSVHFDALLQGCIAQAQTPAPGEAQAPAAASTTAAPQLTLRDIYDRVEAAGYRDIREIEWDDGHFEVKASNAQGQRVKLDVNATTGAIERTRIRRLNHHQAQHRQECP